MESLNSSANSLKEKYIRRNSMNSIVDTRKRRGVQAEINKIESMFRTLTEYNIEDNELVRLRIELTKLISFIDDRLSLK